MSRSAAHPHGTRHAPVDEANLAFFFPPGAAAVFFLAMAANLADKDMAVGTKRGATGTRLERNGESSEVAQAKTVNTIIRHTNKSMVVIMGHRCRRYHYLAIFPTAAHLLSLMTEQRVLKFRFSVNF